MTVNEKYAKFTGGLREAARHGPSTVLGAYLPLKVAKRA